MRAALFTLVLVVGAPTDSAAGDAIPTYVTVVGDGSVRVLLASGTTRPCDSTSNVALFDGWLQAGRTYTFASSQPFVCERHTYGQIRQGDWSRDRLWRVPHYKVPPLLIDIRISTNAP